MVGSGSKLSGVWSQKREERFLGSLENLISGEDPRFFKAHLERREPVSEWVSPNPDQRQSTDPDPY